MNQAFDPFNIFLLVGAVIVILRLRSVLGTRTGHEKRYDPFSPDASEQGETKKDNVIPLPGHEPDAANDDEAEDVKPVWADFAEEGSELARGIQEIASADTNFNPKEFIEGAKIAYEMIMAAFADGDKKSLKPLLNSDVYKGFAGAIDQRASDGEILDYKFVGIDDASLVAGSLVRRKANVTVKFVTEMISATRNDQGDVVDGDPSQIREVTDVWTFERDTSSRDPNWRLSATEATD